MENSKIQPISILNWVENRDEYGYLDQKNPDEIVEAYREAAKAIDDKSIQLIRNALSQVSGSDLTNLWKLKIFTNREQISAYHSLILALKKTMLGVEQITVRNLVVYGGSVGKTGELSNIPHLTFPSLLSLFVKEASRRKLVDESVMPINSHLINDSGDNFNYLKKFTDNELSIITVFTLSYLHRRSLPSCSLMLEAKMQSKDVGMQPQRINIPFGLTVVMGASKTGKSVLVDSFVGFYPDGSQIKIPKFSYCEPDMFSETDAQTMSTVLEQLHRLYSSTAYTVPIIIDSITFALNAQSDEAAGSGGISTTFIDQLGLINNQLIQNGGVMVVVINTLEKANVEMLTSAIGGRVSTIIYPHDIERRGRFMISSRLYDDREPKMVETILRGASLNEDSGNKIVKMSIADGYVAELVSTNSISMVGARDEFDKLVNPKDEQKDATKNAIRKQPNQGKTLDQVINEIF